MNLKSWTNSTIRQSVSSKSLLPKVADPFNIETSRLQLRWLGGDDAAFIYRLVNDPQWLRHIGDKQVHDLDGALHYIESGPRAMYQQFGFGLNLVSLKDDAISIGICGLLKRDSLAEPDLGFAFLPEYRGRGYAREAAEAVLHHSFATLEQTRIVAIVDTANQASISLLEKLGFHLDRKIQTEPNGTPADLYRIHMES
jgi:RimJ/RimL family protein N-acetyltransferase